MTQIRKYNLGEIASKLGLELIGDNLCQIYGIGTLLNAVSGELSFLSNPSYRSHLEKTKASAVIIEERYAKFCPTNALISENPYLSFADATHLFKPSFNRFWVHFYQVVLSSIYFRNFIRLDFSKKIYRGMRMKHLGHLTLSERENKVFDQLWLQIQMVGYRKAYRENFLKWLDKDV